MMKNWLIGCLLLAPSALWAQQTEQKQNEFSMTAQIRPRAEYRNGALMPREEGVSPAYFINNRARLSMEYKREGLSLKISGQHVGVWGQDPQVDKKGEGRMMMNEAWAKLSSARGFFAQLGRQTLSYDDERILGALDWNIAGRYHDALKLGYESLRHQLHLVLAFNQNDETINGGSYYAPGGQPYKNMETLWYHYKSKQQAFNASVLFLNLGFETGSKEKAETEYLQTMGTYLTYQPGRLHLSGAFYYQTGKNKKKESVSAYMWNVRAQYHFNERLSVLVASDYLSGTEAGDKKFKAFDPLYGTHHKFYGGMDYFYASEFVNGAPGLWDNQAGITFKPGKTVALNLNYHYFSTTADMKTMDASYKKKLGSEVDFQLDVTVMKDVKLSAGYAFMKGTKNMDLVKGGNHESWQDWGWISLNINPKILALKW